MLANKFGRFTKMPNLHAPPLRKSPSSSLSTTTLHLSKAVLKQSIARPTCSMSRSKLSSLMTLLPTIPRRAHGRAQNRFARAPYVFMMDADNLVTPPALSLLFNTMERYQYAAAYSILCRFRKSPKHPVGLLSHYDWDPEILVQGARMSMPWQCFVAI